MNEEIKKLKEEIVTLKIRIRMAKDYIGDNFYLNDGELDELTRILEGDYDEEQKNKLLNEITTNNYDNSELLKKISNEITKCCENCKNHECCPEDECSIYKIEQLIMNDKEGK